MGFSNFVCWDPGQVNRIIKPDAEGLEDHVLLAVHSDQRLMFSRTGSKGSLSPAEARDFLEAFMDPGRAEVFSMVLGESGAGKSHFIHWLRLNIKDGETTHLVNIPKVGTSLKGILESIIQELPEEARAKYLDQIRLGGGGTQLTRDQKKGRLLDSIAQALEVRASAEVADPVLHGFLGELPHLFRDPQVRIQHFLRDGSIIESLVAHVFETNLEYTRLEQPRSFSPEDLELPAGIMSKVSQATRGIVNMLRIKTENKEKAVEAINLCLNDAICSALSFTSDHLIELMGEVRAYLESRGMSLILLIEDLSRLQGVDSALLQALTTTSDQRGKKLCPLRWAAAMTTGYFDRLDQTVRTRLHLLAQVEPDQRFDDERYGQGALAGFVARYLNAVRLGEDSLRAAQAAGNSESLPNKCQDCPHEASCHEAFGVEEGRGLYPFTAPALMNMARRTVAGNEHWFNPRTILKRVLIPILSHHAADLRVGCFPQTHLLDDFGSRRLAPIVVDELRRKAGNESPRHEVLQELWSPSDDRLEDLGPGLLEAFNLKSLARVVRPEPQPHPLPGPKPVEPKPVDLTPPLSPPPSPPPDRVIEALQRWSNGEDMADVTASVLRPLVFNALVGHIPWDEVGLERKEFFGTERQPFNRRSVIFSNQTTGSNALLQYVIPQDADKHSLNSAAIALEGLYLFNRHKSWSFKDGDRYLVQVQEHLDLWSGHICSLIQGLAPRNATWDLLDGAVELLTVGASLTGQIRAEYLEADLWKGVWGPAPTGSTLRSPELVALAKAIGNLWGLLQRNVRVRCSGTKGGQTGAHLNPAQPRRIVERLLRNNWSLAMRPDEEASTSEFNKIGQLYIRVARDLPLALALEKQELERWSVDMDTAFGGLPRQEIISRLHNYLRELEQSGISVRGVKELRDRLIDFGNATYDDAKKRVHALLSQEGQPLPSPTALGVLRVSQAMTTASDLVAAVVKSLEQAEQECALLRSELGTDSVGSMEACWREMEASFDDLDQALGYLAGQVPAGEECDDEVA